MGWHYLLIVACIFFQELLFTYIFWSMLKSIIWSLFVQFVMVTVTHFILLCNHSWGTPLSLIQMFVSSNILKSVSMKGTLIAYFSGLDTLEAQFMSAVINCVLSVPPKLLDVTIVFFGLIIITLNDNNKHANCGKCW